MKEDLHKKPRGGNIYSQEDGATNYLPYFFIPVRTEVNGCKGSKGHFNLPDSTVLGSRWKAPSWGIRIRQYIIFNTTSTYFWAVTHVTCLFHLSVTSDFNESAGGVEGSCPAGIDMRSVVIVENPDEVCTFQLGQAGTDIEQRWAIMKIPIEDCPL